MAKITIENLTKNDLNEWRDDVVAIIDNYLNEIDATRKKAKAIRDVLGSRKHAAEDLSDSFKAIINAMDESFENLTDYKGKFITRVNNFLNDTDVIEAQADTDLSEATAKVKQAAKNIKNNQASSNGSGGSKGSTSSTSKTSSEYTSSRAEGEAAAADYTSTTDTSTTDTAATDTAATGSTVADDFADPTRGGTYSVTRDENGNFVPYEPHD